MIPPGAMEYNQAMFHYVKTLAITADAVKQAAHGNMLSQQQAWDRYV